MFQEILPFLIVCPLVFLAGLVDSIAGGGGLISLPAYMLTGLPPVNAIATNKLGSVIGTSASTLRYLKNGYFDKRLAIPSIVMGLAGGFLGSELLLYIDSSILKYPMIIVLPIIAFFVLRDNKLENNKPKNIPCRKQFTIVVIISLLIGIYCGFYGPGTGTFLLLAYTKLADMDVKSASGNVKLVNQSSNIVSTVILILNNSAVIPLGIVAGFFCMAGHYIGSGIVMKSGIKAVRPIIVLVLILLIIKLLIG